MTWWLRVGGTLITTVLPALVAGERRRAEEAAQRAASDAEGRDVIEVEARVVAAPDDEPTRRPAPTLEQRAEALGAFFSKAARTVGERGAVMREQAEKVVGLYRLLRAMGLNDAEIAGLVAGRARGWVATELLDRAPDADDARRAADDLTERVVRVAAEVDDRLGLHGDFVRPVREGLESAKAGREDAITGVERSLVAARALFRTLLTDDGASAEDDDERPAR